MNYPIIHQRERITQEASAEIRYFLSISSERKEIGEVNFLLLILKEMQAVVAETPHDTDSGAIKQLHAFKQKYELTDIEYTQILCSEIQTTLKYALRMERHGDAEKPAGLE